MGVGLSAREIDRGRMSGDEERTLSNPSGKIGGIDGLKMCEVKWSDSASGRTN